jgi:hypothetical protein
LFLLFQQHKTHYFLNQSLANRQQQQVMYHAFPIRFTAIVLLSLVGSVQSLAWNNFVVKCQEGNSHEVCGYVSSRTCVIDSCSGGTGRNDPTWPMLVVGGSGSDVPSVAAVAAGSDVRRDVEYSFVDKYFEGQEFCDTPNTVVTVSLTMDYECAVVVNGEECTSCSYCGQDQYTVDCTNMERGRTTECEAAVVDDNRNDFVTLFYPLTAPLPLSTPSTVNAANSFPSYPPSPAPTILALVEGKEIDDGGDDVDDGGDEVDDSESSSSWTLMMTLCSCL